MPPKTCAFPWAMASFELSANSGRRRPQYFKSKLGCDGRNLGQVLVPRATLCNHLEEAFEARGQDDSKEAAGPCANVLKRVDLMAGQQCDAARTDVEHLIATPDPKLPSIT
ncbi:hypothetical protein [Sinorhizobium fredii]|uniref:hypothetical protein n=1 Tax=Rhizobium fredii TaxID=380 RepID=UPI001303F40C|nr:hypothetical protein [Sinorhizobium fredii]